MSRVSRAWAELRKASVIRGTRDLAGAGLASQLNTPSGPFMSHSVSPETEAGITAAGMQMGGPFSPGRPINQFFPEGSPLRQWDFPTGINIGNRPRAGTGRPSFATLQNLLGAWDTSRLCIEHIEDDIRSLGPPHWEAAPGVTEDVTEYIGKAEKFWAKPDGTTFFDSWQQQYLEDMLRFDAATAFKHRTRNGKLGALEIVSGVTMAPLLDYWGHPPTPPAPSHVQYIQGVPAVWIERSEVIYSPFRLLPESPYGLPPIEWLVLLGNTDIRFQWHFLQYFTEGSMPEAFMEAPPDASDPEQIVKFQAAWDAVMEGDSSQKHKVKWVPAGSKPQVVQNKNFDAQFPLHLMRKTAAAYKVTPNDLGFTDAVNKASADTQTDVQFRIGTLPKLNHLEAIYSAITQEDLGLPLVARFDTGREKEDRYMEAQAHELYVKMGAESVSEVREGVLGLKEDPRGMVPRFIFSSRAGAIPLHSLMEIAGDVETETAAPAPGSVKPLPVTGFTPAAGVVRDAKDAHSQLNIGPPPERAQAGAQAGGKGEVATEQGKEQAATGIGAAAKAKAPATEESHQPGLRVIDVDPAGLKLALDELAVKPTLLLLRHGETAANAQGLLRSWTNPKLNQAGKKSADDLAAAMGGAPVVSLYSSDLDRASETARAVSRAVGVTVEEDDALRPWNLGDWAGTPATDHLDDMIRMETSARDEKPPAGESFNTFLKRYIPRLQKAMQEAEEHPDQFVVLVTHVRNLRVAEAWLKAGQQGIDVDSKTVTSDAEIGPGGYQVLAMQDHADTDQPEWRVEADYGLAAKAAGIRAAGLAVKARDTGRVLLIQRWLDPQDGPAAGMWEFPGGKLEPGEDPRSAAIREWQEEVGIMLPAGEPAGDTVQPSGLYQLFVWLVDSEDSVPISGDRHILNPDDPDGDHIEVAAWWNPDTLPGMPALRREAQTTDWRVIDQAGGLEKALRQSVERQLDSELSRLARATTSVLEALTKKER